MALGVKRNEQIYCQELVTGECHSGFVVLGDARIITTFYSYEDFFFIDPERPLHLRTAYNSVISLYLNIPAGSGTRGRPEEPDEAIYHQSIISSIAIIGADSWTEKDRVKFVSFIAPEADLIFRHTERMKGLITLNLHQKYDGEILSIQDRGILYRVRYVADYAMGTNHATRIWPIFEIEFDNGVTLFEYYKSVDVVASFLSLTIMSRIRPDKIEIRRLSSAEVIAAVERHEYEGAHSVEYVWSRADKKEADTIPPYPLFLAWNDERIAHFRACLAIWIDRTQLWSAANKLMVRCISLEGEMTAGRLLAACTWFEEIPDAKPSIAVEAAALRQIVKAAQYKASAIGYAGLEARIGGALEKVRYESRRAHFSRLITSLSEVYGNWVADGDFLKHLQAAMSFRGESAHGHLDLNEDTKYLAFAKAVYAMEALCFLLTVCDFPMTADFMEALKQHRFVQNYRLSHA